MERRTKYIVLGVGVIGLLLFIGFIVLLAVGAVIDCTSTHVFLCKGAVQAGNLAANTVSNAQFDDGFNSIDDSASNNEADNSADEDNEEDDEPDPSSEPELTQVEDIRIESANYLCALTAPSGFSSNGIGFNSITIKNIGAAALAVDGEIKVSVAYNDVKDETVEFNSEFNLARNGTKEIKFIDAKNAGFERAYLWSNGKTGSMTVRIDLPDNKFIEATKSLSGNPCS